jgi:hypothetical protein
VGGETWKCKRMIIGRCTFVAGSRYPRSIGYCTVGCPNRSLQPCGVVRVMQERLRASDWGMFFCPKTQHMPAQRRWLCGSTPLSVTEVSSGRLWLHPPVIGQCSFGLQGYFRHPPRALEGLIRTSLPGVSHDDFRSPSQPLSPRMGLTAGGKPSALPFFGRIFNQVCSLLYYKSL